ncbi:unnamed protein product [Protopolystoma xenopodis]|uniref:Uncharacterized protein n=1 Tax=Protopolystoma xenopodis TaxID=117903 RepID=A0A448X8Q3_9PLAT|nr:unnamed protein product [Protopolystoma xenopodis]
MCNNCGYNDALISRFMHYQAHMLHLVSDFAVATLRQQVGGATFDTPVNLLDRVNTTSEANTVSTPDSASAQTKTSFTSAPTQSSSHLDMQTPSNPVIVEAASSSLASSQEAVPETSTTPTEAPTRRHPTVPRRFLIVPEMEGQLVHARINIEPTTLMLARPISQPSAPINTTSDALASVDPSGSDASNARSSSESRLSEQSIWYARLISNIIGFSIYKNSQ